MCGIFTIIKKDISDIDKENVINSYEILNKRGPDNCNIMFNKNNITCFTRLSINDLSFNGNQPFFRDNIILLCNGEIYNSKQLIEDNDLQVFSKSDCECIIELYKKYGFEKTVEMLDGVFSIILIDDNKCYFARDRIGVRPLFYSIVDSGIVLGSVARSVCNIGSDTKPVKPCFGFYDLETNKITTYDYKFSIEECKLNEEQIMEQIKNNLIDSVKKRLLTDRPFCSMLSGGLDSSVLCSILCKELGNENVNTFSIGMEGSEDLKYSRIVANHFNTNHTEVVFSPREGFECIPEVIKDLETYDITTIRASVGMWLLSKYISENTDYKVVFSGEGADELYMGYLYFHFAENSEIAKEESLRLVKELYKYDVLRTDRSISSHGLEARVPFLDKKFVDLTLSIPGDKLVPRNSMEKYILRKSFDGELPDEILWRRKDGFSDALSSLEKPWYKHIEEFVDEIISDDEFSKQSSKFPSKESYYYRKLYDGIFSNYDCDIEFWQPKWIDTNGNPSGRLLFENIKK